MFKVEIKMDNAAFEYDGAGFEVARILRKVADRVEEAGDLDGFYIALLDINGNKVGEAEKGEES